MRTQRNQSLRYKHISPRTIKIGLFILGLILMIDILAARYSPAIQSSLTLPVSQIRFAAPTHIAATQVAIATQAAVPTHPPVPSPTSSVTLPATGNLAQDTFQRPNQAFWGTASDGQAWGANAKSSQGFAIVNHTGQVTNGNGVIDAILGPAVKDSEVVISSSLTHYATASIGPVLRWTDANNLYKVFLGGGQLILLKKVAGVVTVLKTAPFPVQDGASYTFRFRARGSLLLARVWPTGQAEPSTWTLMATDSDLQSGYGGMRIVLQSGTTATITSFMESSL